MSNAMLEWMKQGGMVAVVEEGGAPAYMLHYDDNNQLVEEIRAEITAEGVRDLMALWYGGYVERDEDHDPVDGSGHAYRVVASVTDPAEQRLMFELKNYVHTWAANELEITGEQLGTRFLDCQNLEALFSTCMLLEVPAWVVVEKLLQLQGVNRSYNGDPMGSGKAFPFQWEQSESDIVVYG